MRDRTFVARSRLLFPGAALLVLSACPSQGFKPKPTPPPPPIPNQDPGVWGGVSEGALQALLDAVWGVQQDLLKLEYQYPSADDPAYDPATAITVLVKPTDVPKAHLVGKPQQQDIISRWAADGLAAGASLTGTAKGTTVDTEALLNNAAQMAYPFLNDAFTLELPAVVTVTLGTGEAAKSFDVPFSASLLFDIATKDGVQVVTAHALTRYAPSLQTSAVREQFTQAGMSPTVVPKLSDEPGAPGLTAVPVSACHCDAGDMLASAVTFIVNELAMPLIRDDVRDFLRGIPLFDLRVDRVLFSRMAIDEDTSGPTRYLVAGGALIPSTSTPVSATDSYAVPWAHYTSNDPQLFGCMNAGALDVAIAQELTLDDEPPLVSIHRSTHGDVPLGVDVTVRIKNPRVEIRDGGKAELVVDLEGSADAFAVVPELGRLQMGLEMTSLTPPSIHLTPTWDAKSNSIVVQRTVDGVADVQFSPSDDALSILVGPLLSFLDSTVAPTVERLITGALSVAGTKLSSMTLPVGRPDPSGRAQPYETVVHTFGGAPEDCLVLSFQPTDMVFQTIDGNLCAHANAAISARRPTPTEQGNGICLGGQP